ncbi:MAG: DUF3149 domain-containing protein [Cellvibrionaceae bacterium]
MYIDGVILFSLLMIALIIWMMAYVGLYCYRHIKLDTEKELKQCKNCDDCEKDDCRDAKILI